MYRFEIMYCDLHSVFAYHIGNTFLKIWKIFDFVHIFMFFSILGVK